MVQYISLNSNQSDLHIKKYHFLVLLVLMRVFLLQLVYDDLTQLDVDEEDPDNDIVERLHVVSRHQQWL